MKRLESAAQTHTAQLRLATLLICLLAAPNPAASAPSTQSSPQTAQVGLVIVAGDQAPETYCVALDETPTTGLDLLLRAGVTTVVDQSTGIGTAICRIGQVGCRYPAEECFCQCQGAECTYWTYFKQSAQEPAWRYAQEGAAISPVTPGSVDAWIWAPGAADSSQIQPPPLTFAAICGAATLTIEAGTSVPAPQSGTGYVSFGFGLLALGGIGIWVYLRRRQ